MPFICGARRLLYDRPERTEKHFRRHSGSLWQRGTSGNTHLQGNSTSVQLHTTNNLFSLNFPHKQFSTPDIPKPTHYTTWNLLTYCGFTNNTKKGFTSTNSLTRPSPSIITHLFFNAFLFLLSCQSFSLSLTLREECMGRGGALCLCWTLMMVRPLPLPPTQCMSTHGMCVHLLHGLHVDI